jgi:hypothetical protein
MADVKQIAVPCRERKPRLPSAGELHAPFLEDVSRGGGPQWEPLKATGGHEHGDMPPPQRNVLLARSITSCRQEGLMMGSTLARLPKPSSPQNFVYPNEVILLLEAGDVQKARDFAASSILQEAMQQAGVVDKPDAYFLE